MEEEDFDAEAFRKQCEEVIPRYMVFLAKDDELPVTDTPKKLKILMEVIDEYEKMDPKPFAGEGGMICV